MGRGKVGGGAVAEETGGVGDDPRLLLTPEEMRRDETRRDETRRDETRREEKRVGEKKRISSVLFGRPSEKLARRFKIGPRSSFFRMVGIHDCFTKASHYR